MSASPVTFDRLAYIDSLVSAGVEEKQARAHAAALNIAMHDTVATRSDIEGLDNKIDRVEIVLNGRIDILDAKIDSVEHKLRGEIAASANRIIYWVVGTGIAMTGLATALSRLPH